MNNLEMERRIYLDWQELIIKYLKKMNSLAKKGVGIEYKLVAARANKPECNLKKMEVRG